MMSRVALREGLLSEVEQYAREAQAVARAAGDGRLERIPLHMLAVAARMGGDRSTARRLYEQSIELNRSLGELRMAAAECHNLAYVELHDGAAARARTLFDQARTEAMQLGYDGLLPYLVADRAALAAEDGDPVRSARLLGVALAAFEASGQIPDPDDAAEHARLRRRLADELGEGSLRTHVREGARELPVAEALRVQ